MGRESICFGASEINANWVPFALGQKLVTSKTPQILTPSEIALPKQDLKMALAHPAAA